MLKPIQFIVGFLLLLAIEIFRVFFIMPFPGSQQGETIGLAYFINDYIFYLRAIGLLIIIFPLIHYLWLGKIWKKILVVIALGIYGFVFYNTNHRFAANRIFREASVKTFQPFTSANTVDKDQLVLGIEINGKARAYPLEVIGYHHLVNDTLDGQPLMITYCTVCRTGRVFSPMVEGRGEQFKLVGMDHFNAMFEDASTGSWWRQVNGEAVAGPLKGKSLTELPASQMRLSAWVEQFPNTEIMQPDTSFRKSYEHLEKFDEGTTGSPLTRRDSLSWKEKSWVVGVQLGMSARAYDWNDLVRLRVINDTLGSIPIVVVLESDSATYHVWKRDSLTFILKNDSVLTDELTNSSWNWSGKSIAGPLAEKKLPVVQSYQEFWHSWRTFRPHSTRYKSE
jgi:hypothetical protein